VYEHSIKNPTQTIAYSMLHIGYTAGIIVKIITTRMESRTRRNEMEMSDVNTYLMNISVWGVLFWLLIPYVFAAFIQFMSGLFNNDLADVFAIISGLGALIWGCLSSGYIAVMEMARFGVPFTLALAFAVMFALMYFAGQVTIIRFCYNRGKQIAKSKTTR
jgi:hypothetical protein